MPSATSNLKAKINDLKTRVAHNSISPVFVGGILDEIVDASTAAAEAAAAQSTADSALALATANSDRLDLHADDINNLGNDVANNAADIHVNTEALTILNRRGQVEPFAAVITTDPDDDPIPEELVGKRVWSTQFNKFLEINIGGDPPYREPEDSAAVVDKFYVCDGRLYLGVKVSQTATTLKPLFDSEIEQLCRTHSITLTAGDDGALSWSGAEHSKIRNGDVVTWENMGVLLRGTVISRTSSGSYDTLAVVYDFDGDEPLELHVLWINSNGTATDACFSSDQTLASAFNAKQTKLEDTPDVVIESETDTTDGLYLTDSAKRAVFNDMFNLEGNIPKRTHSNRPVTAKYDPENAPDASHPYWCNKTWLTYEEAVDAYNHRLTPSVSPAGAISQCGPLRAVICSLHTIAGEKLSYRRTFFGLSNLEVARLSTNDLQGVWVSNMQDAFHACSKLKEIIPAIIDSTDSWASWSAAFAYCAELESFQLKGLRYNLDLKWSPKLSLATMQYLVDNASTAITAEKPVVVTVHADVFAKLTGDMTNEAAAALTDDEKTAWAAVLTAATSKYISFAID
jgi:hypothetical protein